MKTNSDSHSPPFLVSSLFCHVILINFIVPYFLLVFMRPLLIQSPLFNPLFPFPVLHQIHLNTLVTNYLAGSLHLPSLPNLPHSHLPILAYLAHLLHLHLLHLLLHFLHLQTLLDHFHPLQLNFLHFYIRKFSIPFLCLNV